MREKSRVNVVSRAPRVLFITPLLFRKLNKSLTLNIPIITSIIDKATLFETKDPNKRLSPLILILLTFVTVHLLCAKARNLTPARRKISAQRVCRR